MIKFVYFDLGKVLLDFSHQKMCNQIAAVSEVDYSVVHSLLFESDLNGQADRGQICADEYYDKFCSVTGSQPDKDRLFGATADIFCPIAPVWELADRLRQREIPVGILSNTCDVHWNFITQHYRELLEKFSTRVLSFEVGFAKPDAAIYERAIELTGLLPDNIYFIDDREENVIGAQNSGIVAARFIDAATLELQLKKLQLIQ